MILYIDATGQGAAVKGRMCGSAEESSHKRSSYNVDLFVLSQFAIRIRGIYNAAKHVIFISRRYYGGASADQRGTGNI